MKTNIELLNVRDNEKEHLYSEVSDIINSAYAYIKKILNIKIQFDNLYFIINFNQKKNRSSFSGRNIVNIYLKKNDISDTLIFKKVICDRNDISLIKHSLCTIISHELTHIFTYPTKFPFWFSEGLAEFISYKFTDVYLRANLMHIYLKSAENVINDLNTDKGKEILKQHKNILDKIKYILSLSFISRLTEVISENTIFEYVSETCNGVERNISTDLIFRYFEKDTELDNCLSRLKKKIKEYNY